MIFGTNKSAVFMAPMSVVDLIADVVIMLHFVQASWPCRDSGQYIFHSVSLFKDRADCWNL